MPQGIANLDPKKVSKSRKSCHFLRMLDKKWFHWLGHNLRQLSQAFVANFCLVSFPFFFEDFRFCLRAVGRLGERFRESLVGLLLLKNRFLLTYQG